ncbi:MULTISPECIES: aldo/keto reductase [Bacillaceae]|uniref:aldo/keto reductase n=1 Tax=Bacillaceae TaxID=186817 RepID=UPI001E5A513B|nr:MULTISPECIES: aldo/keto reductase [Bacillaceae]MCE4047139.1 aldo/keto reductase [Bacillus sp. Au-Bac7]MDL0435676.1 aldo/keto reductase [Niallia sp. SS-2023]UPO86489.1 aldo/keto reductase [Niallia sp. Man26]
MKKNRLGQSDLHVSALGLGCMSLGTDEKTAFPILEAALEAGVNYFDTADLYDFGQNEQILGKFFKQNRENVIIASKAGNKWQENKEGWTWDASKAYIKEAAKQSLKRLDTDYIDLYQLHGGTLDDPIEETIEAFEELKAEGYIRYYGISSIRPNVIREYVKRSNIVSVMMQYSILDRRPEEEALPLLHDSGISVVTRGPVAKGLLSDNYLKKLTAKGYLDYSEEELRSTLEGLQARFEGKRSILEAAVQYNLSNPAVATVIAGASSVEQLQENARAVNSIALTQDEQKVIQAVSKASFYKDHR